MSVSLVHKSQCLLDLGELPRLLRIDAGNWLLGAESAFVALKTLVMVETLQTKTRRSLPEVNEVSRLTLFYSCSAPSEEPN